MSVTESRERPDLPTLTESLPLDEAGLAAALAAARKSAPGSSGSSSASSSESSSASSPSPASSTVDIELPFKVRAVDDGDVFSARRRGAPPPVIATPFAPLLDRLLDAGPGPFGLTVEVKHDHRVVGIWDVYLGPSDPGDIHVPQASGILYACVAADGNLRETAAFFVLEHWWVNSSDPMQFDELYEGLTYAILDRLDALMDGRESIGSSMPPYVLYLVDGRSKKPRVFKAARLERALLRALGDGRAVPGLDLHVAYGRGTGVSPISATLPSDLPPDLASPDVPTVASDGAGTEPAKKAPPPEPVRRRAEEVFVAERLSEANLRWMRKGSGATV